MSGAPHEPRPPVPRGRSLAAVILAYLAAGAAALWVGRATGSAHPLVVVAVADLAATALIFALSVVLRNSSTYDPYWSLAPPVIGLYFCWVGGGVPRAWLVLPLLLVYAVRLTGNWAVGWPGLHHEDWRYRDIRRKTGALYWPASFLGIHLLPTVLVYLGCLPLYPAIGLAGARPLGWLDAVAATLTVGGIALEGVADAQLRAFVRASPPPGAIMDRGLWALSRHPNYLGEVTFWWGLFAFGLAGAGQQAAWTLPGPASITLLFLAVSIPMIERRMLARRPGYAEHRRRMPALVPRPWRWRTRTDR